MTHVPHVRIVADSTTIRGHRLTSIEVEVHRFVLAELNTHAALRRSSASSRAVPLDRQIRAIESRLALPLKYPSKAAGMQGGDPLTGAARRPLDRIMKRAAASAIKSATKLDKAKVHKSITNRLLEPFMWHRVIITGTAWENFFDQRCSPLAQEELMVPAYAIRDAYDASTPRLLKPGEAHLPFLWDDEEALAEIDREFASIRRADVRKFVSSARAARVSYLTHDGRKSVQEDLRLYADLTTADPKHWVPMEHVAEPCPGNELGGSLTHFGASGDVSYPMSGLPKVGAYPGWFSHRHEIEARENTPTFR